nr:hypothetical protein CFP56_31579 [Quercus suber]
MLQSGTNCDRKRIHMLIDECKFRPRLSCSNLPLLGGKPKVPPYRMRYLIPTTARTSNLSQVQLRHFKSQGRKLIFQSLALQSIYVSGLCKPPSNNKPLRSEADHRSHEGMRDAELSPNQDPGDPRRLDDLPAMEEITATTGNSRAAGERGCEDATTVTVSYMHVITNDKHERNSKQLEQTIDGRQLCSSLCQFGEALERSTDLRMFPVATRPTKSLKTSNRVPVNDEHCYSPKSMACSVF